MKRSTALILIFAFILSALCGCTGHTDETVTLPETVTAQVTDPESAETTDTSDEPTDEPVEKTVRIGGVPLSEFCIVTAADDANGVKNAAADLQRLIKFAEGYELPLVSYGEQDKPAIILGAAASNSKKLAEALNDVRDDGYAMCQDGRDLYISGVINRGTANGVYDFLQDHLGVRFYSETFTYVKKEYVKDVEKDQLTVFNPVFPGRYNWSRNSETKVCRFTNRTKSTSIKYAGSHNLGTLSKTSDGVGAQPCLSNENVLSRVFDSLCAQIEKNPSKTLFHINQNDGGRFCTCAECKAKNEAAGSTAMGSLLVFINEIARRVRDKYPDRDIDIMTYAYKETTIAPDPSFVTPEDNVVIVLCMMDGACFNHAYNDPSCEHNSETYKNMQAWSRICKKFAIYDYSYNHSSYVASVGPDINVMWDNFQVFKELGCTGLLFEGEHLTETGEFCELRNYLINRLMWTPDVSREQFIKWRDEFLADYYGEAAPYILQYIELLNDTSRRPGLTEWNGHTSVYTDMKVFYAPKVDGVKDYTVINECYRLWDAVFSCSLDDEQLAHAEKSSIHFYSFMTSLAQKASQRREASALFQALSDKYTKNQDSSLTPKGVTEGFSADVPSEGIVYRLAPDGTLYVSDVGDFRAGMLVIPSSHDGKTVPTVGECAFSRAGSVVEAHIAEGVKKLGTYCFRGCPNLTAVYLPASLEVLGYGSLGVNGKEEFDCPSLKDVYYGGTVSEWESLYGAFNAAWKTVRDATVHCADGDISL